MEAVKAWCPQCGNPIGEYRPLCESTGAETPLYVEINAVAQFIVGVPTFVEFRLINVSDRPLTVDSFQAFVGSRLVEGRGVCVDPAGQVLTPGTGNIRLADRKVALSAEEVQPGEHILRVAVAFHTEKQRAVLVGESKIVMDPPGTDRLHIYDPLAERVCDLDGVDFPGGESTPAVLYGEAHATDPRLDFIRGLKRAAGFRFLPLRMTYEGGVVPGAVPECSDSPPSGAVMTPTSEARAFCPHCWPPKALPEPYGECPYCGKDIPLHLTINHVPFFMENVRTRVEFRLHATAREELRNLVFRALLDGAELPKGPHQLWQPTLPPGEHVVIDRYLEPSASCGKGECSLTFELQYDAGGAAHHLTGAYNIVILPQNATRQQIVYQLTISGHNVVFDDLNIPDRGFEKPDGATEFIRDMVASRGPDFRPVELHAARALPRPMAPTAPPAERTCLTQMVGGVPHHFCIITKDGLAFGRKPGLVDIRLYHIADMMSGNLPQVSRLQWRVTLDREDLALEVLADTNPTYLLSTDRVLKPGAVHRLRRGEGIEIREHIGLNYTARAPRFHGLDAAWRAIRQCLDTHAPHRNRIPEWCGEYGGYALTRRYSLAPGGEQAANCPGVETYVAAPGWVSLGASQDACIHVQGPGVLPLHACLLHMDAYFFVCPWAEHAPVCVDGVPAAWLAPQPIGPGAQISLGGATLTCAAFQQLYVPNS